MNLLYLIANQTVEPSVGRFIAKVARQTGAAVDVLAAASNEKYQQEVENSSACLVEIFADIEMTLEFATGDIRRLLNQAVETKTYDLVLMGVHRRRKIWPSEFRQLSNKIIRDCPIPIMLVRKVSDRFERMLVCTGGFETAERVVELSAKLAGPANMQTTLLHVSGAIPSMYTGLEEMEETIEELLSTDTPLAQHLRRSAQILTSSEITAEVEVRHGDVVEAILEEAVEGKFDLIVIGETGARKLTGMLMGNVTQQIINRAASAVLVYKTE